MKEKLRVIQVGTGPMVHSAHLARAMRLLSEDYILEAVVEDQGVHYVFVREEDDDDCFEKREVALGQSDGRRVPILKGLQEGELVVVSGAVHVKLAGVTAVPAGHTHNH